MNAEDWWRWVSAKGLYPLYRGRGITSIDDIREILLAGRTSPINTAKQPDLLAEAPGSLPMYRLAADVKRQVADDPAKVESTSMAGDQYRSGYEWISKQRMALKSY